MSHISGSVNSMRSTGIDGISDSKCIIQFQDHVEGRISKINCLVHDTLGKSTTMKYESGLYLNHCDGLPDNEQKNDCGGNEYTRSMAGQRRRKELNKDTDTLVLPPAINDHVLETNSSSRENDHHILDEERITQEEERTEHDDPVPDDNIDSERNSMEEVNNEEMQDTYFPNLSEKHLLRKLQEEQVTRQLQVLDSLTDVRVSNLRGLEHMNKADPAVKRVIGRSRLTAKEVKEVPVDADIEATVNEFLTTNMTGNFVMGRVLQENYCRFYSWLTAHLQVERNAWAVRLKQTLDKVDKEHRDSLTIKELLATSANRIQNLILSCSSAMSGAQSKDSKDKNSPLSEMSNTQTIPCGNVRWLQASTSYRDNICSNERAHNIRQQNLTKVVDTLDRHSNQSGESCHSSNTSPEKVDMATISTGANNSASDLANNSVIDSAKNSVSGSAKNSVSGSAKNSLSDSAKNSASDSEVCSLPGDCCDLNISRIRSHSSSCLVTQCPLRKRNTIDVRSTSVHMDGEKLSTMCRHIANSEIAEFDNDDKEDVEYAQVLCESIDVLNELCSALIKDHLDCLHLLGVDPNHCSSLADAVSMCIGNRHDSDHKKWLEADKRVDTLEVENRNLVSEVQALYNSLAEKTTESFNLQGQIERLEEALLGDTKQCEPNKCLVTNRFVVNNNNQINRLQILNKQIHSRDSNYQNARHKYSSGLGEIIKKTTPACTCDHKITHCVGSNVILPQSNTFGPGDLLTTSESKPRGKNSSSTTSETNSCSSSGNTTKDVEEMKLQRLQIRSGDEIMDINGMETIAKAETQDERDDHNRIVIPAQGLHTNGKITKLSDTNCGNQKKRQHFPQSLYNCANSTTTSNQRCTGSKSSEDILEQTRHPETGQREFNYQHQPNRLVRRFTTITMHPTRNAIPSSSNYDTIDNSVDDTLIMKASHGLSVSKGTRKNSVQFTEKITEANNDQNDKKKAIAKCVLHSNVVSLVPTPNKEPYPAVPRLRQDRKTIVSKCLRCQKLFNWPDNHKLACSYHSEKVARIQQCDSNGRITKVTNRWTCCLQAEDAEGCYHGKHI